MALQYSYKMKTSKANSWLYYNIKSFIMVYTYLYKGKIFHENLYLVFDPTNKGKNPKLVLSK